MPPKASLNVSLTPELTAYITNLVASRAVSERVRGGRAGLRLLQREDATLRAASGQRLPGKGSLTPKPASRRTAQTTWLRLTNNGCQSLALAPPLEESRPSRVSLRTCRRIAASAFVVMLHLPPDRKSILPELIGRWTAMPVSEANGWVRPASKLRLCSATRHRRDLPRWPPAPPPSRRQRTP